MATAKKQRLMSETPRELDLLEYVGERVTEIADLLQVVDNHDLPTGEVTQGPRTVLQRLPRHMRRRAMSYNVKRLPRSQRCFGISAIAKSTHRAKPPSRFHRRRASNLLNAYIRRQRRNAWLETHIWHAKRFLMRDIWGYRLAESSYQRGFRPAYRDSVRHCLVRDISYMRCLQLSGDERGLVDRLGHLCAKQLGPTIAFRAAQDGHVELSLILYRKDRYPMDCIGPVRLMWMPRHDSEDGDRTLWIWVHPSSAGQLLSELIDLFGLIKNDSRPLEQTTAGDNTKEAKPAEATSGAKKTRLSLDAHKVETMEGTTVEYSSGDRIKLTDLRDQLVRIRLSGRLSLCVLAQMLRLVDVRDAAARTASWMTESACATYADHHRRWQLVMSQQSPAELKDGVVTSLLIEDPRLSRPPKKGLCKEMDATRGVNEASGAIIPDGAIWSSTIRRQVLRDKMTESDLQKLRAESTVTLAVTSTKIPVLVVVRNGGAVADLNMGAGVDLIAPGGFGMPLWLAELIDGWTEPGESFYVLRDRAALKAISVWIEGKGAPVTDLVRTHRRALIAVSLNCAEGGCPGRRALICLPADDDRLTTQWTDEKRRIVECRDAPTTSATQELPVNKEQPTKRSDAFFEDFVSLDNEVEVSMQSLFPDKDAERTAHRKAQQKQRKQRRKDNSKSLRPTSPVAETTSPPADINVVDSCARPVIGFVVRGGFSFAVGRGRAVGYCSLAALERIVRGDVLFRNTTSKVYHSAKLSAMKLTVNI
uniref:Pop1 N-terminal domain-containing protein n=1 Tax=Plectus sambesii TaxID=2011161 RepID=A0A914XN08_9BILA